MATGIKKYTGVTQTVSSTDSVFNDLEIDSTTTNDFVVEHTGQYYSADDNYPVSLSYNSTGSKVQILESNNPSLESKIVNADLLTNFKIDTAQVKSEINLYDNFISDDFTFVDMHINHANKFLFILAKNAANEAMIYQYSYTLLDDVDTYTFLRVKDLTSISVFDNPSAFRFNNSGTVLFLMSNTSTPLRLFSLSSAFNISTINTTPTNNYLISNNPISIDFDNNGNNVYYVYSDTNTVEKKGLTSPFTFPVTSGPYQSFTLNTSDFVIRHFRFCEADSCFYVSDNRRIRKYILNNVDDLSSVQEKYVEYDYETTSLISFNIIPDENMFATIANDTLSFLNTTQNFYPDIANTNFSQMQQFNDFLYLAETASTSVRHFEYADNGTKLFVNHENRIIYRYDLSTPYDLSTATYDTANNYIFPNSGTYGVGNFNGNTFYSFTFNNTGTKIYLLGYFYMSNPNGSAVGNVSRHGIVEYDLASSWTIQSTTAVPTFSFELSFNETIGSNFSAYDLQFDNDGDQLFVMNPNTETLYKFELSSAYDLSTATYNVNHNYTFDTTETGSNLYSFRINDDGSKIFVAGNNAYLTEHNFGTNYDLSTITYANKRLHLSRYIHNPTYMYSFSFTSNGNKLFMLDQSDQMIVSTQLKTAYELDSSVDTLTFTNSSTKTGTLYTNPISFEFSTDGTKMYVLDYTPDKILQFSLTTAYDPTTRIYDNTFLEIGTDTSETNPHTFKFSADGTKLVITGSTTKNLFQFNLTSAWDLSTASYQSVTFSSASQLGSNNPMDLLWNDDGSEFFILDSGMRVVKYTTSSSYDLTNLVSANTIYSLTSFLPSGDYDSGIVALEFSGDGNKLFVYATGTNPDRIRSYSLTTAYSFDTTNGAPTYDGVILSLTGYNTNVYGGMSFNGNGSKLFVQTYNNANSAPLLQIDFTTNYDLTGITSSDFTSINTNYPVTSVQAIRFNNAGTKALVLHSDDVIYEFDVDVAHSLTDMYPTGNTFSAAAQSTSMNDISMSKNGEYIYVSDASTVYQYNLTTPFDITTASYSNKSYSITTGSNVATDISVDGKYMYLVASNTLYQHNLSTPYDVSTMSYSGKSFNTGVSNIVDLNVSDDGKYIIFLVAASIYQCNMITAFDLSTAYLRHSLSTSSQSSSMTSLSYADDGNILYLSAGNSSGTADNIFKYTFAGGNPYSLLSFSKNVYNSESLVTQLPTTGNSYQNFRTAKFSSDGKKLFVGVSNTIYEFILTTPYDVTTSVYKTSKNMLSVSSMYDFAISNDGTRFLFVRGDGVVYVRSLNTPFSVDSYDSAKNIDITLNTNWDIYSIATFDDNVRFAIGYYDGSSSYYINVYTTSGYTDNFSSIVSDDISTFEGIIYPYGIAVNGNKIYVLNSNSNIDTKIHEYEFYNDNNTFANAAIKYTSNTFVLDSDNNFYNEILYGLDISRDFSKIIFSSNTYKLFFNNFNTVQRYVDNPTYLNITYGTNVAKWFRFLNNGSQLLIKHDVNNRYLLYSLSTPYDLKTAFWSNNLSTFAGATSTWQNYIHGSDDRGGIKFYQNGTLAFGLYYNSSTSYIWRLELANPYDVETAITFSEPTAILEPLYNYNQSANINKDFDTFEFSDDGLKLYLADSNTVYEYDLPNPYDIQDYQEMQIVHQASNYSGALSGIDQIYNLRFFSDGKYVAVTSGLYGGNEMIYELNNPWTFQDNNVLQGNNATTYYPIDFGGISTWYAFKRYNSLSSLNRKRNDYTFRPGYDDVPTGLSTMDYSVSPEYSPDGKYLTYISPYGGGLVQHKVNIPHTFANINTGANDRFKSPNIIEYRSGGLGYNFNFNNDGTRIYYGASNYIYQRDLTIPYDISSISSTVKSAYLLYHLPNFTSKSVTNVLFTNNGYTLWYSFNQYIVKVPLSVPYDITNGSEDNYIDLPAGGKFLDFSASGFDNYNYGSAIYDFKFNNDGTILYVSNGSRIWQINLTTPYDWTYPYTPTAHDRDVNIATYSNRGTYSQSASTTLIFDFTDGDHNLSVGDYFTVQFTSGTYATSPIFATYQVDIVSTATQVRTIAGNTTVSGSFISYNNDVKSFSNQNTIYSFDFSPDGTELFVSDDYDNVGVYRLTTAFDISTAVKMNSYDSNSSYTQAGSSFTNPLYFNVHSSTAYPIYLRVLNNNDVIMYNAGGNLYKLKYDKNHLKYYNHRNNILEFKQPFTDIDNIKYYSNGTVLTYYNNLTNKITVARLNTPNIISSENVQSIKSTEVPLGSILTSTFVTGTNERYAKPDFAFTNDGLKLFFKYNNKLYYFTLSSAFDLSTLSEFKWLYNFGNQDAYSYSFDVSADGTKLIMLGGTSDRVYEYDVDGTTVTYTNKYYSVNSQITTDINKVKFDNNGLKFYVTGKREKKIFEYDTASAFTIAPEYNLKMVDSSPQAMEFNSTGSSFYVLGDSTNAIYQFDMNTNYDVSKSTYASKSLSVTNEETSPKGFTFNSTGSKLYVVGETNSTVFEYSLATPFDVSTGTYSTNSFSVYSQEQAPSGMKFNNDGSKMYIIGNLNQQITEYSLATPYDLSTATYNNVSLSLSNNEILPNDFAFNNDGTKIFIIGSDSDYVYQYLLSSAYDLSTATYSDKSYDVSSNVQVGTGISFSADGKNMYIVDSNESSIYRYDTGSGSVGVVIYTCPANTAAKLLINASGEYGVMKIGDTPIFEYTNSGIYHTTSGHKPRSNTAVKFYASDIEYTIGADDVHQEYYMVGPNEQLKLTESKNSGYSVYVIEDSTGS